MMHKDVFGAVYSKKKYICISVATFAGLFVLLSIVSEFIFLSPVFVFYIPPYAIVDFVLIVAISFLSAIVTSFSIYRIRMNNNGLKIRNWFFGANHWCKCRSMQLRITWIFCNIHLWNRRRNSNCVSYKL